MTDEPIELSDDPVENGPQDLEEKQPDETYDHMQGFSYPDPSPKDSFFKFFRDIIKTKDSTKVSNLDASDLHNVRLYQDTALYLEEENCVGVAGYFKDLAEIHLATAMAKKGWLVNTAVTQTRRVERPSNARPLPKGGFLSGFGKKNEGDEYGSIS